MKAVNLVVYLCLIVSQTFIGGMLLDHGLEPGKNTDLYFSVISPMWVFMTYIGLRGVIHIANS